jgi:hypothetical protein
MTRENGNEGTKFDWDKALEALNRLPKLPFEWTLDDKFEVAEKFVNECLFPSNKDTEDEIIEKTNFITIYILLKFGFHANSKYHKKLLKLLEQEGEKKDKKGKKDDDNKGEAIDIDLDEKDINPALIEKAERLADRILTHGDPIKYIARTVAKKHTGDEKTIEAIAVSIGCQSCRNSSGIQVSVNGDSGSGKSHGVKTYLHLVSKKWKITGSLSPKAIYYSNAKPGMIVFSDDTDPDEAMQDTIKRATTNFQEETYHLTVSDQKGLSLPIPPRIIWLLTSVQSDVSDQVLNRQLVFETDSSLPQKLSIFDMQASEAERGENGNEVNLRVLICRRIHSKIKESLFNVKIPFAKKIKLADVKNSRIFPLLLERVLKLYNTW